MTFPIKFFIDDFGISLWNVMIVIGLQSYDFYVDVNYVNLWCKLTQKTHFVSESMTQSKIIFTQIHLFRHNFQDWISIKELFNFIEKNTVNFVVQFEVLNKKQRVYRLIWAVQKLSNINWRNNSVWLILMLCIQFKTSIRSLEAGLCYVLTSN